MMTDPKNKTEENPKDGPQENQTPRYIIEWDYEKDNCGINRDENPCGDASEY